ncbi:tetratricopeptide repeat protein [Deltaproteobacteria bacterium IMCC39524]|nr:tetratricopeptide repeat protein [Deltaproteobacteria bacterium IMCC39524]
MKTNKISFGLFTFVLFCVLFVLNTFAVFDGDYFWHVNTGQWIWENHALPVSDPFSFTVKDSNPFRPESVHVQFVLKQYWLGQLALYALWEVWGETSAVVLRALINSGLILAVFVVCWHRSNLHKAIIFGVLTLCQLQSLGSERPVLFTYLFVFLLLCLLEKIIDNRPLAKSVVICLPLIMIIWANMHGGYILGLCLIAAYIVGIAFDSFRSKESFPVKRICLLFGSGLLATANPAGLPELIAGFFQVQSSYASQVTEARSTVEYFIATRDFGHPYFILALLTVLTLAVSFKKMRTAHLLSIGGVLTLSLLAVRYKLFLFLLAPLITLYLPFSPRKKWSIPVTVTLVLIPLLHTNFQSPLAFKESDSFPAAAVDFMHITKPAPNLFNYYDWGGYLANKIPEYQVFIDGRALVEEHYVQHNEVVYLENLSTLDAYNINTAIFPTHNLSSGGVIPLAVVLTYHPDWVAVFVRDHSMVFVRNVPENKSVIDRYAIPVKTMFKILIDNYDGMLKLYPDHYRALVTKAQLQEDMGDFEGAISSLQRARAVNPESVYTKQSLQRLTRKKN